MNRLKAFVLATCLLMLVAIMAAPVYADNTGEKENIQPSVSGNVQDKKLAEAGHPSPDATIKVAEILTEKKPAVPEKHPVVPEVSHIQQNAEMSLKNEQKVELSTDKHAQDKQEKQDKNADSSIDASYKSNKTAVKAVERNITLFTDRLKEKFSIWLERSARYIDIMKDILKEKQLPEELVFLPIVESGFNPNAYSRARAVGPWQFIEGTAKRYGLVVDWWRDERKDPVKSTKAAADYLKDLYAMFGSWNFALAAYNAGEGKILRALRKTDAEDYWSLLHTRQIKNETKEYVPRYIAATMIANNPEDFGFYNLVYHEPLEYDEVTLYSPVDIEVIAKSAETTEQEIKELNPELRRWSTPPNVLYYTVRIPSGSREFFFENLSKVPPEERFSFDTYTVKKGDNLKKIAKKLNVPVSTIIALNSMSGIEKLDPGEEIIVPPKDKYYADIDDRMALKKASYKKKSAKKYNKNTKGYSRKSKVKTKKA
jgi:membrane-bound lytic murein transglycosylase D